MKQNQITIKDIENIEKNPEALLKIEPTRFNKTVKKYLNGLTLKNFENNKELAYNITNAFHVDNAMIHIKKLEKYNIKYTELKIIAPNLFEACKENPRFIDLESKNIKKDIDNLTKNNIKVTKELLTFMHSINKGIIAIKQLKINEVNDYVGIVKHFFRTKGHKKAFSLIHKIFDICYPGSDEKTRKRKNIEWFKIKKN